MSNKKQHQLIDPAIVPGAPKARMRTNVEMVTEMMEFSDYGALSQVFIMSAIQSYAKTISSGERPTEAGDSIISNQGWFDVAVDTLKRLEGMIKENNTPGAMRVLQPNEYDEDFE